MNDKVLKSSCTLAYIKTFKYVFRCDLTVRNCMWQVLTMKIWIKHILLMDLL